MRVTAGSLRVSLLRPIFRQQLSNWQRLDIDVEYTGFWHRVKDRKIDPWQIIEYNSINNNIVLVLVIVIHFFLHRSKFEIFEISKIRKIRIARPCILFLDFILITLHERLSFFLLLTFQPLSISYYLILKFCKRTLAIIYFDIF